LVKKNDVTNKIENSLKNVNDKLKKEYSVNLTEKTSKISEYTMNIKEYEEYEYKLFYIASYHYYKEYENISLDEKIEYQKKLYNIYCYFIKNYPFNL
jgi:hypothetical protein